MADILSASQLAVFRGRWIGDEVNHRVEWNPSATTPLVDGAAAAAAITLGLDNLGTGTIRAGTVFALNHGGLAQDYVVKADVLIVAGDATVTFAPPLVAAVLDNALVSVKPLLRSLYNRGTGGQYFSDSALFDIAKQAEEQRGGWIAAQDDYDAALFTAMRVICIEQMLNDSGFRDACEQRDATAAARFFDRLEAQLRKDRALVDFVSGGAGMLALVR